MSVRYLLLSKVQKWIGLKFPSTVTDALILTRSMYGYNFTVINMLNPSNRADTQQCSLENPTNANSHLNNVWPALLTNSL